MSNYINKLLMVGYYNIVIRSSGRHGGTVAVASQQEGPGFESNLRRFCVEFACSPRVRVGLLWFPPTVQKHVSWE